MSSNLEQGRNGDLSLYAKLLKRQFLRIGHTPLIEIWPGSWGADNRVFAKCEFENPCGSHYDRVYRGLFEQDLEQGKIGSDLTGLVEVTSGNAGAAFAWFCWKLGLRCKVFLPGSVPTSFISWIRRFNPDVDIIRCRHSDGYLQSTVNELRRFLEDKNKHGRTWYCPNHSRRKETLQATEEIGGEVINQLSEILGDEARLDYFVPAAGNGASIVGPARRLRAKWPSLEIVAFEPTQAPVFSAVLGEKPRRGEAQGGFGPHRLYGTGAWGIEFPFLEKAKDLRASVMTMEEREIERAELSRWRLPFLVGRTSLVGLAAVERIIEKHKPQGKNFLVLFYDRGEKYHWLT